jgi:hypothetical protein
VGSGVTLFSVDGDMPENIKHEEQKWKTTIVV